MVLQNRSQSTASRTALIFVLLSIMEPILNLCTRIKWSNDVL